VGSMAFHGARKAASIKRPPSSSNTSTPSTNTSTQLPPARPLGGIVPIEQQAIETAAEAAKRREGTIKVTVRGGNSDIYLRFNEKDDITKGKEHTVFKEGRLKKRAQGKSKLGSINWKERYFKLTGYTLSYFDGNPGLEKAPMKGSIPLARIRQVTDCTSLPLPLPH
jgi:hypothetical protein